MVELLHAAAVAVEVEVEGPVAFAEIVAGWIEAGSEVAAAEAVAGRLIMPAGLSAVPLG